MVRRSRAPVLAVALTGATALAGCSSHQRLATQAVDFNRTVEKAQNEMLLLNVIRAKDRLPMYLTGMSSLSGNVQTSLSAGLGGSYSRVLHPADNRASDSLTRTLSPSVGASVSANPTYSLAVLDTQEFMRGFLTPLSKNLLAYYWNQGWPRELLIYLLVERVEIARADTGEVLEVLRNYPSSADPNLEEMTRFGAGVETFLLQDPQIEQVSVPESVGPPLPASDVQDLAKLVEMAQQGLSLVQVSGQATYQLQRQRTDVHLKLKPLPEAPKEDAATQQKYYQSLAGAKERLGAIEGTKTITFFLRSPEALLYYLGELARVENRQSSPKVPEICIQGRYQPLFVAFPSGKCPDAVLSAESGQGTYAVPALSSGKPSDACRPGALRLTEPPLCDAGRSMQAFSLLNQVTALQKSAKDLPSTALVRVIE
ncbi:MAG: hypothetical protein ACJ76N_32080 [Thermoanaerobaculia bacterium]